MTSSVSSASVIEEFWKDDFAPLASAGKAILRELREDESAPDADVYRRMLSAGEGSHLSFGEKVVGHDKSIPLPDFVVREAKAMRASQRMGLFPEASLAWMSVDHKLFLWPFGDSADDICSLSIPTEAVIVSVGLTKPKKGKSHSLSIGVRHCCTQCFVL